MGVFGLKRVELESSFEKGIEAKDAGTYVVILLRNTGKGRERDYLVTLYQPKGKYVSHSVSGGKQRCFHGGRTNHEQSFSSLFEALKHTVHLVNRKKNRKTDKYNVSTEWFKDEVVQLQYEELISKLPCQVPFCHNTVQHYDPELLERYANMDL
jgi:hypothetical protein